MNRVSSQVVARFASLRPNVRRFVFVLAFLSIVGASREASAIEVFPSGAAPLDADNSHVIKLISLAYSQQPVHGTATAIATPSPDLQGRLFLTAAHLRNSNDQRFYGNPTVDGTPGIPDPPPFQPGMFITHPDSDYAGNEDDFSKPDLALFLSESVLSQRTAPLVPETDWFPAILQESWQIVGFDGGYYRMKGFVAPALPSHHGERFYTNPNPHTGEPGDSGGPVFTSDGKVFGVISSVLPTGQTLVSSLFTAPSTPDAFHHAWVRGGFIESYSGSNPYGFPQIATVSPETVFDLRGQSVTESRGAGPNPVPTARGIFNCGELTYTPYPYAMSPEGPDPIFQWWPAYAEHYSGIPDTVPQGMSVIDAPYYQRVLDAGIYNGVLGKLNVVIGAVYARALVSYGEIGVYGGVKYNTWIFPAYLIVDDAYVNYKLQLGEYGYLLVNHSLFCGPRSEVKGRSRILAGSPLSTVVLAGRIMPGNSTGTLTIDMPVTMQGATLECEIASFGEFASNGVQGWDLIEASKMVFDLSSGTPLHLELISLRLSGQDLLPGEVADFDPSREYRIPILRAQEGIFGYSEGRISIDAGGFLNNTAGGHFSVEASGNDLLLVFTPVPEPSAVTLLFSALLAAGLFAARHHRS